MANVAIPIFWQQSATLLKQQNVHAVELHYQTTTLTFILKKVSESPGTFYISGGGASLD